MNLTDIRDIRALQARHGFHFSKSMGQNFLIADWVPRDIANAAGLNEHCAVLEIGPGIGCLTQQLARPPLNWTLPFFLFWTRRWEIAPTWRSFPAM